MRKNSVSTCFCAAAAAITAKISKFHQIGGYPVGRVHMYTHMYTYAMYTHMYIHTYTHMYVCT